jgi:DNA-binding XRE family transcriptional regulator
MAIAEQHGRLTGEEIRFLRKWFGWSGADFAERFGVQRSTVHRWEHDETQMPSAAEMMLRVIAKHEVPIESYAELVSEPAASQRKMTLRRNLSVWKADGEAA